MRQTRRHFTGLSLIACLLILAAQAAWADADPPSRVARINFLSGVVSFQPAGVSDWAAAVPNRPMTTGDRLWTDTGSRAELQLGFASLRLDGQTSFSFLNLDDRTVQIQLAQGSLNVRLRILDPNESFEVDTPNLALTLLRPGEYRIDADPSGSSTIVMVRGGDAEANGGGRGFAVHARQRAQFSGTDSLTYDISDAPAFDDFDDWCGSRDRREDRAASPRYVSRGVIGYEDLDEYGSWRPVPGYGTVWVPTTVVAGWAPYRYGHWAWVEPWGWTWVDDAPWGFAPFHYGRWIYTGGVWAWVPGPVVVRPVYSPALVAFVGGSHFSLSVSFGGGGGGVAWFPLGPGEVYVPAYRASRTYITNVNTSNTVVNSTYITNVYNNRNNIHVKYVNQAAPGAVTAVPKNSFVNAQPVGQAAVSVPSSAAASAQVTPVAPVAPVKTSALGAGAASPGVSKPPAPAVSRKVVAKLTPPPPAVPFEKRQAALAANPGRPLDKAALANLRPIAPATHPLVKPVAAGHPVVASAPHSFSNGQPVKPQPAAMPARAVAPSAPPAQAAQHDSKPAKPSKPIEEEKKKEKEQEKHEREKPEREEQ